MSKRVDLLVIDPQTDFCDPKGNLFVAGADEDMQRLAALIRRMGAKINDIHCTLDQHHMMDVAHPIWWKDGNGKHPDPFTIITAAEVKDGIWRPSIPSLTKKMVEYVEALEASGRYPLCIWPPHCLIGSVGAAVVPEVMEAFNEWVGIAVASIDFVSKGSNPYVEHYSGVQAEVPDPQDPSTQLNTRLIDTLSKVDEILLAGEAGSHCLANTVRDIANNFGEDEVRKLVFLEDLTSPVTGFEQLQEDFLKELTAKGMRIAKSTEIYK